jgi:hypothetical protein
VAVRLLHEWPRDARRATAAEREFLSRAERYAESQAIQEKISEEWSDWTPFDIPDLPKLHVRRRDIRWARGFRRLYVWATIELSDDSVYTFSWKSARLR